MEKCELWTPDLQDDWFGTGPKRKIEKNKPQDINTYS